MSVHLPECDTQHNHALPCICAALEACQARVEESMDRAWTHTLRVKQAEAYANGVQAARDAAASVGAETTTHGDDWTDRPGSAVKRDILRAIDALQGES